MTSDTPLRDRILDTAHRLVLERGFSATTLRDILDGSEASKGAFFHHFPSKAALGHALVARYAEQDAAILDEYMAEAEAATSDPAGQLVAFVHAFERAADDIALEQPGCLFVSFVYEHVPESAPTREVVREAVEQWRERILDKLRLAAADGRLDGDVDLPSLADQVFTTFEGAFVLARATGDPGRVRAQLAHLRRYLELVLGVQDDAKQVVRAFVDAINRQDWERLESLVAPDFRRHSDAAGTPPVTSRAQLVDFLRGEYEAFPDGTETLGTIVAEGDLVAARHSFSGTQRGPLGAHRATGCRMQTHYLAIYRLEDGRIVESWAEWDNLTGLRQLGHATPEAEDERMS